MSLVYIKFNRLAIQGIEVSDRYNLANVRASLSTEWVGYSGLRMTIDRRSRIEYALIG
jgi:hypothetical protein